MILQKSENLKGFGISGINVLALFYGKATTIAGKLVPQNVCVDALHTQHEAYKLSV